MKKLLLLLIAPILMFSQDLDFSKAYSIKGYAINIGIGEQLQDVINSVPNGEVWYVYLKNDISVSDIEFSIITKNLNGSYVYYMPSTMSSGYFTEGESIKISNYSSNSIFYMRYVVFKFKINSQAVLASASSEIIENKFNRPRLYPNPTSSLLALNSDKEYDIEVYDMAGNKVMALTGNNINMAHLSTATYIVKATDKSNNEELTYKVVKN